MSKKSKGWGILGTSPISSTLAKAIQESSSGKIVAIGSRSITKAEEFAKLYAIPKCYSNYDELLADPEIDVVYLGLPNHLHKEWIIRCAQAGKHILCEKPLVTDISEAKEIFAIVPQANIFCMEALMYRCHPFISKLQDIIRSKIIGDISFINASYMANIASVANPTKGGAILNLGCYPISLIRLLVEAEPVEMFALGKIDHLHNNDQRASIVLKFPHQILATINTGDDIGMFFQFDVYGTNGHLKVETNPWLPDMIDNRVTIYCNKYPEPIKMNVTTSKSLYSYQVDVVNQCISEGLTSANQTGISWEDSLGNIAVLDTWRQQILANEMQNTSMSYSNA